MMRDAVKRCRMGLYFDNVKQVTLENVTLEGVDGENLIARHVGRVTAEGSDVRTD